MGAAAQAGTEPDWPALAAELDRWAAAGRAATFWWRDDDAGTASPELARLLALTGARGIVPLLAVVPDWAEDGLAALLAGRPAAAAQHGVAHRNRAASGAKKTELVDDAPDLAAALPAGMARLRALLPAGMLLPVLVPPWNRIGPRLAAGLAGLGYRGLSLYGPRPAPRRDGLLLANCHVDPVDWHGGRGFLGRGAVLAQLLAHLRDRREGRADAAEPTGILSHHAAQDGATWAFLERLADTLSAHPAAAWQHPADLFGCGAA